MNPGCGTYAGYQAHNKRGEAACKPCKAANSAYVKDLRIRTGRTQGCLTSHVWPSCVEHGPAFIRAWQDWVYCAGVGWHPDTPLQETVPVVERSVSETVEEYGWFKSFGWSDERIAAKLGLLPSSLQQALRRARQHDLRDRA